MCISVIIPSYNRAHLLQTTIPTYFQEGVGEVIIIDDCSTDNTQEIINKMSVECDYVKNLTWKECKELMDNIEAREK